MSLQEYEIRELIQKLGIETKDKGDEVQLHHCPYCEAGGTKESFSHFSINAKTGLYNCLRGSCSVRGNIYRLLSDFGKFDFMKARGGRQYSRPKERPELTADVDRFYSWYQSERGISPDILKKYGVGYEKSGGKRFAIVYQYRNAEGELINRKYRLDDKSKMWCEKDCELGYYGIQHVSKDGQALFVVEGEDDCHALAQIGIDDVVSVPSGATAYTPAMDSVNATRKWIILLFDNDPAGQAGAKKFAEKAGLHKCVNVVLPYKDARECLKNGMDIFGINAEIMKAKRFEYADIAKAGQERESVIEHMTNPDRACGVQIRSSKFNEIMGGIRLKELTILIGHSGHGKTTLALNIASWVEVLANGYNTLILPFENRIESVIQKMVEIETGESIYRYNSVNQTMMLDKSKEWIDEQITKLDERHIWFLNKKNSDKYGYYTVDKLEEIIRCAVKFYDVKFVLIDHLHYFLKLSESNHPVLVIDEAMRRIKLLSEELNIHVLMIVHPNKTEDGRDGKPVKLGMNSGKGASSIVQECDNYWTVERHDADGKLYAILTVHKNRNFGRTGKVYFEVSENRNTYLECKDVLPEIDTHGAW